MIGSGNLIKKIKKNVAFFHIFFLGTCVLKQFLTICNGAFYLVENKNLIKTIFFFRNSFSSQQKNLFDIVAVDNGCKKKRFLSIFILGNNELSNEMNVCIFIEDNETVNSLYKLFPAADWLEREAWDLMGINFGTKNKKRILSDYSFIGHSLRKNFPKSGFYESKKSEAAKVNTQSRTKSLQKKYKKFDV